MPVAEVATAELVRSSRDEAVACIRLDRPSSRNALNEQIRQELRQAFEAAEADPAVRAVLVTAEGDHFCAGADIHELEARTMLSSAWHPARLDVVVEAMSKPVIGALKGYVLGGGLELSMCFTLRMAARSLQAGLPEIRLGVFPALGGTQRLPRLVGEGRALELMLSGRTIDAEEAHAIGLVTHVVDDEELDAAALALAKKLSKAPPIAARVIIEATRRASDLGRAEGLDYERRLFGLICATDDKREGIEAWKEKRRPEFSGR